MKLVIVAAVLLCYFVIESESQGFLFNRQNGFVFATRPTTTTKRTTTRRTPPTPIPTVINDARCKYGPWSVCGSITNGESFRTRTSKVSGCKKETEKCDNARVLAQAFRSSFGSPDPSGGGGSVSQAGSNGGGGIADRSFPSISKNVVGRPKAKPACTKIELKGSKGISLGASCSKNRPNTNQINRKKRQVTEQTTRDLVIMIDVSYSIGRARFRKLQRIAIAIVKLLCEDIRYHRDYTRIAITSFSGIHRVYVNLNNFLSVNQLVHRINSVIYGLAGHRTCIANALENVRRFVLHPTYGGRVHPDVYDPEGNFEQDIILITDGCENCIFNSRADKIRQLEDQTYQLILQGIHSYVIGIGLNQGCREMLSVVAQGGRCFHFFYLDNWDYDLEVFAQELEQPPGDVCLPLFEQPLGTC